MHLRWQIAPAKAQVRVMVASQAWTAPRWTALSIITGSVESTRHPSAVQHGVELLAEIGQVQDVPRPGT